MIYRQECFKKYLTGVSNMGKGRGCYQLLILVSLLQVVCSREPSPMDEVTHEEIVDRVDTAFYHYDMLKVHENNIRNQGMVAKGSPYHGVLISYRPEAASMQKGRAGVIATRSMQMMVAFHCRGMYDEVRDECAEKAYKYTMVGTRLHSICSNLTKTCTQEELSSVYRSITGHCNQRLAQLGESFTAYIRYLNPFYLDNIETVRRAVNKSPLPNARSVSGALTNFEEIHHDKFTMAVLQWGQFLEHDLSRPAISPMYHFDEPFQCCRSDGFPMTPRYSHKFCSPISISNDPFYNNIFKHCMSYARSLPAVKQDCHFGPQQQLNQATHYHDGSQIYGSSLETNSILRDSNGYYKTSKINGKNFLPLSQDPEEDCLVKDKNSLCFVSGDPRVNFEPQLVTMYTLWVREHNRLVDGLKKLNNDHWSDDDVYEEARRIVIAMMQHITYDEWAKTVLAKKYRMRLEKHLSFRRDSTPGVFNSVGVAVFRGLKSLYVKNISLVDEDRNEFNNLSLKSLFYKPEMLKRPGTLDSLVRGMATQRSGKVDMSFDEDLINNLYIVDDFGYDILALDIQRGRDHGLPPYNHWREHLGMYAESFEDFGDVMSSKDYNQLSKIYTDPNDVDLIVGGMMEKPVEDSLFGPIFSYLLTNQLTRARQQDRYFYTNPEQPKPFTKAQIQEINKVTLARIMCDNSDIKQIQPNVFLRISKNNNLVSCGSVEIPRLDLRPWMEANTSYTVVA